jgi:hypothetical protein
MGVKQNNIWTNRLKQIPHLENILIIALFMGISVLVWLPTRFYPYHWDAAGYIINEAVSITDRGFWPLDTRFSDFAHPPALPLLLALAWNYFGESKAVSHALLLPFLPLLLISIFFIGKKTTSITVGIGAAFLAFATPVIIAEYGNVYPDLPVASLTLAAIALWLYRLYWPSMVIFSAAVLFKESALFLFPVFLLLIPSTDWRKKAPYLLSLLLPLIAISLWFIHHHAVTGWWIVSPNRQTIAVETPAQFVQSLQFVVTVFLQQNRWLLATVALIAASVAAYKQYLHQILTMQIKALLFSIAFLLIIYSLAGEFAMRYSLAAIGLSYVVFLTFIEKTFKKLTKQASWAHAAVTLASLSSFILVWHPTLPPTNQYSFSPPSDLGYLDTITVFRQLGAYASLQGDDVEWYGSFPENIYLTQPIQKYVNDPVLFDVCSRFVIKPGVRQFLVLHPYAPEQIVCQSLLPKVSTTPLNKLVSNDKWIEIYEVNASQSAKTVE